MAQDNSLAHVDDNDHRPGEQQVSALKMYLITHRNHITHPNGDTKESSKGIAHWPQTTTMIAQLSKLTTKTN